MTGQEDAVDSNLLMNCPNDDVYKNIYPSTTERALTFRFKYLLFRWKGSVFKLIWHEVLIYMAMYYALSIMYRYILYDNYPTARQNFELFCVYCGHFEKPAAVAILTGFYVSNVVSRWWDQFMSLPWPDQLALKLVTFMPGRVSKTNPRWPLDDNAKAKIVKNRPFCKHT